MKRDMDLVRQILLSVEAADQDPLDWIDLEVPGFTSVQLSYHVMIMDEAGLLEGQDLSDADGLSWLPKRLTWAGHEFLDAIRSDTIWQKTKSRLAEQMQSAPFEIVKAVAIELLERSLFG